MASECAPIALFAFRRPDHLAACLASLSACAEAQSSDLIVFCDGPRDHTDVVGVATVRRMARAAVGFAQVTVIEQEVNLGLAASVISGVTTVLADHDRVVVVEDDLVVSPDFLRYLNDAMDLYAGDGNVASIHAYVYAVDEPLPQTFFLRGADCWGWATWRHAWEVFEPDGVRLQERLRASGQDRAFDLDGAYPYSAMLEDQVAGTVDSWAVRWYASAFLADMVTLYPGASLVENIGQDGSGTHSQASASHAVQARRMTFPLQRIPVEESAAARTVISRALARAHGSTRARLMSRLPRWKRP